MTDATPADRPARSPDDDPARLIAAAERAIRTSGIDPHLARKDARRVLDEATARGDAEAASVAWRALALAARELGDLPLAETHLQEAIRVGADVPRRLAQARMSLVSVRTEQGDPSGALQLADQAEQDLPEEDRAALAVQRAIALVRLGRHVEAVRLCDSALDGRGADADPRLRSAVLLNRGLALTYLGDHDSGAEDLADCLRVAAEAGLDYVSRLAEANLSFNAVRRGDIPAAFASFASVEHRLAGYPERLAALRSDFAEALVAAHLPGEARALLRQAVPELTAAGALVHLAEARLFLAQVELLAGNPHGAIETVRLARQALESQDRHTWIPLADDVAVRARLALDPAAPGLLAEVLACADALHDADWFANAAALRLTAARLAADLGDTHTAEAQLDLVVALCEPPASHPGPAHRHDQAPSTALAPAPGPARRPDRHQVPAAPPQPDASPRPPYRKRPAPRDRMPPQVRTLTFHHAVALRRRLAGEHAGALEAVRAGLSALGGREGPWDIRAHAARPAQELAELGLESALLSGDGATVLAWAERWRACVRAEPPVAPDIERLYESIGDAVLLELVRHGDALTAVTATRLGSTLHRLGSYRTAVEATVRLRYCLRRRGLRDTGTGDGIAREAATVSALLLGPLTGIPSDVPVVIVPTGALHTVPWPVLPPLRGRAVCVAPSATAWLTAVAPPRTTTATAEDTPIDTPIAKAAVAAAARVVVATDRRPSPAVRRVTTATPARRRSAARVIAVAGPGLAHAEAEASMVVRVHDDAVRVPPRADAVLRALGSAEIAHIAAHGVFCAHSPLLSSLTLDDGPLMAYDLLRLDRAPRLVVLSACDAGMAHTPVDGAPLGLAGTFLDRGSACVVASLVPVRDDEALALMTAFHRLLATGIAPAEALAAATDATGVPGFICLGAGWPADSSPRPQAPRAATRRPLPHDPAHRS
ncbi:CHAT domain-containing protein [Thermopolyspora sp. NPDC052614]|uniref:CHAT domain-containing protein n=1 Tax=Thermopolyspora sp. NPDC052614 TaxID=3155682 RepID=UPI003437EED8